MGVPAFFRWLSRKYPSVIVDCVEERVKDDNGETIPPDSSKPNPNGIEFDNLYLDMNGIIHPCTHPEDKPAPKNEDEMMVAIFECIDRIFAIVRPRKLLYMAIDGVAPRAKMNQQRSRRFRASKESAEKAELIAQVREELLEKGAYVPPVKEKGEQFDSNCITPGTPFMHRLSLCLQYYVHDRIMSDAGWRNIKVILSDANVPGEGEHKIMDYIRRQRAQPAHDPNTHHVLCGADADLIMLGLATHEPNFTIIREEFKPNKDKPCDICSQIGHETKECTGAVKPLDGHDVGAQIPKEFCPEQRYIFVRLNVLREYLERELEMPNLPFKYDFERAIDDWVMMCFFVGNDFLPHLPSLEIREGAIDRLVKLYKKTVYKTGGFLTRSGVPNLARVQLIMQDLGEVEDEIFKKRQENELSFRERNKAKKRREKFMKGNQPVFIPQGQFAPQPLGAHVRPIQGARQEAYKMRVDSMNARPGSQHGQKRKHEDSDSEEEEPPDEVRLWEDGFKDRYYESKFDIPPDDIEFRHNVACEYAVGLCWVLRYYYQGCSSWKWYFPYHYAPFASDFVSISDLPTEFEKGTTPFNPLEQLMGVFPAASKAHVPEPWGKLMDDPNSPIIDFYPEDFKIDLNGKRYAWQGVALLPFVSEERLKKALKPVYPVLTKEEVRRNIRGDDRLYVNKHHSSFDMLMGLNENQYSKDTRVPIDGKLFQGMAGLISLSSDCVKQGGNMNSPVTGLPHLENNTVVCVRFKDPQYGEDFLFPSKRLDGAINPPRVLKPTGMQGQSWQPVIGMAPRTQMASLGQAGHRMLAHNMGDRNTASGQYSSVPPPSSLLPTPASLMALNPLLGFLGAAAAAGPAGIGGPAGNNQQRNHTQKGGYNTQRSGTGGYSRSRGRGSDDYSHSRGHGSDDYSHSRGHGSDDYSHSRGRGSDDYSRSRGRGSDDYSTSSRRGSYGHSQFPRGGAGGRGQSRGGAAGGYGQFQSGRAAGYSQSWGRGAERSGQQYDDRSQERDRDTESGSSWNRYTRERGGADYSGPRNGGSDRAEEEGNPRSFPGGRSFSSVTRDEDSPGGSYPHSSHSGSDDYQTSDAGQQGTASHQFIGAAHFQGGWRRY